MKNEIVKVENKILVGTPFEGLRVQDEKLDNLKTALYDGLLAGHRIVGTKAIDNLKEETLLNVEMLSKGVLEHHGGITTRELSKALQDGFMGVYGQFYGVTVRSVMGFLKAYKEDRKKLVAQSRLLKEKQDKANESKHFRPPVNLDFWNLAKAEYLTTGFVNGELHLYDLGIEMKLINMRDEALITEMKIRALKFFEGEYEKYKGGGGIKTREILGEIKEILDASEKQRQPMKYWRSRCKRIAVQLTFEQNK